MCRRCQIQGLFSAIELVKDKETKEPLVEYNKDPENILGGISWGVKEKRILNLQPRKQYYCGATIDHYRNRTS